MLNLEISIFLKISFFKNHTMSYKIIFLGSPDFAVPTLEKLKQDKRFEIIAVFSQPDKKIGRNQIETSSAVKKRALELKIKVYTPENINTPANIAFIQSLQPDFLLTVAYGQIIAPEILKIPKIEALNLHGSLLPKYRGASPIQSALLNGENETGISIMRMITKMDAGEIFYQTKIAISKTDDAESLFQKISEIGSKITPDILAKIAKNELKTVSQNENDATYCKKIKKEDGQIDWQNETAQEILNKIRAYTPWPSCYTTFQDKTLKILKAHFLSSSNLIRGSLPGTIIQSQNTIHIVTKSGTLIPEIVQLEGKKPLQINDFIKGKPEFLISVVGN